LDKEVEGLCVGTEDLKKFEASVVVAKRDFLFIVCWWAFSGTFYLLFVTVV